MDDEFFYILLALLFLAILILGPVGFFLTLGARGQLTKTQQLVRSLENQLERLRLELSAMQARLSREASPAASDTSEGIASQETAEESPPAEQLPPETEPQVRQVHQAPQAARSSGTDDATMRGGSDEPSQDRSPGEPDGGTPASDDKPLPARNANRPGLEERLGTRWTVWIGGIALALGALMLVRYAIDQGFFGPGARVLMGLLLSAALIGFGERMRRRDAHETASAGEPETPSEKQAVDFARPSIPAMLTAAGTVAGFGSIYAAHALYGFIGPAIAFLALGAAAVATMFAAALHGPMLAGIGLVAALAVPVLVNSNSNSAWPVVLYVAVVAGAAYWLARFRRWLWLAVATAAGAGVWAFVFLLAIGSSNGVAVYHAALVHVMVHSAMALFIMAWDPYREAKDNELPASIPAVLATAIAALCLITLTAANAPEFSLLWPVTGVAVTGILTICGVRIAPAISAVVAGALLCICALLVWPGTTATPGHTGLVDVIATRWSYTPLSAGLFATFAIVVPGLVAASAIWKVLRGAHLNLLSTCVFAGTAVLTPLLALLAVYLRYADSGHDMMFAAITLGLALTYTTCAQVFRRGVNNKEPLAWELGLGITASAAIAALAIGLTLALDGGTLTIALALAALGAAFVAVRLDIAALRWCVAGLGIVLAARFLWNPGIAPEIGQTPIFNWLLAGYGIPALCFGLSAWLMKRAFGEDRPVRIAQAMTILFAAALVFFEIRHFSFGNNVLEEQSTLIEQGLFALSSLAFAIVLLRMDGAGISPVFRYGSYVFAILSGVISILTLGITHNPYFDLFTGSVPGGKVFNGLMLAYLIPGFMALLLGRMADGVRPRWYVMGARITAMFLIFCYLTLQVRLVFQGPDIAFHRSTGDGEFYTYSAVWLSLGIALLAYGLWRKSVEVRIASALFIVLSVLKVFLMDLAGLDGILRALSFIGLGGVLIGIGLVYQKYVFARPAAARQTQSD